MEEHYTILIEEAKSESTSQERLSYLADRGTSLSSVLNNQLLRAVLVNPATGPDILLKKINIHPNDVLAHPNCPIETLYQWIKRGNSINDLNIIRNPRCPTEILFQLLGRYKETNGDLYELIVQKIESHPNYPEDPAAWAIGLEEW
jgi:hypothetical protein